MKVDQPTLEPTAKVAAAGIGGSLSILIVYGLGLLGLSLPPEVAAALTALVSFAAGYLVKERT